MLGITQLPADDERRQLCRPLNRQRRLWGKGVPVLNEKSIHASFEK